MSITYTADQEININVVKDLADYYNFDVAAFYWCDNGFHFREFITAD